MLVNPMDLDLWIGNNWNVLFTGKHGVGKCLGKGTPILMYDGSVKNVEDIQTGDVLMGPDSTPRNVLNICSGKDDMYKVIPKKGEPYRVNSAHILSLKMCSDYGKNKKNSIVNIPILNFMGKSRQFKTRALGWRTPVQFQKREVPFDPYFLGIWLGDGSSDKLEVTSIDQKIIDYLEDFAQNIGLTIHESVDEKRTKSYNMTSGNGIGLNKKGRNILRNYYNNLDLFNNKHIPEIFKINDEITRLQLLAGIIDTDGSLSNNCYDVICVNKKLAEDIVFVARSLGFACYMKKTTKSCLYKGEKKTGIYYRITISGEVDRIPVKIDRKKAQPRRQRKDVLKTNLTVIPDGYDDYYGFVLDGDHLFVLGDFTVTHNTAIILEAFNRHNLKWVYFSASTMDPWVDFIGIPKEKMNDDGSYLDLVRPERFYHDDVEAIFMDEFNRSHKKVRNAVMELIQFKAINGKKYNNLRMVWAAINPDDEDDDSMDSLHYDVEPIDPAQKDRFQIQIDIPYKCDKSYFVSKYGTDLANPAVEWWNNLDKDQKDLVSPRRLDYVLQVYQKGGNIRHVVPSSINASMLLSKLTIGDIKNFLIGLKADKEKAKKWLDVRSNFELVRNELLKPDNFDFFLPFFPKEEISTFILEKGKKGKDFRKKFLRQEFLDENPDLRCIINEILLTNRNNSSSEFAPILRALEPFREAQKIVPSECVGLTKFLSNLEAKMQKKVDYVDTMPSLEGIGKDLEYYKANQELGTQYRKRFLMKLLQNFTFSITENECIYLVDIMFQLLKSFNKNTIATTEDFSTAFILTTKCIEKNNFAYALGIYHQYLKDLTDSEEEKLLLALSKKMVVSQYDLQRFINASEFTA